MDIHLRFWSEKLDEVVDEYFDTHSVGHEPAELQAKNVKETLDLSGIPIKDMTGISRDNPNVMKACSKKIQDIAESEGNVGVVDMPCNLHPVHTSFEKMVKSLESNIEEFLVDLHAFFKLSTARREDRNQVQAELSRRLGEDFEEVCVKLIAKLRFITFVIITGA